MAALPNGSYVLFAVNPGTTPEALAAFFVDHGLDITPECIDMRKENSNCCMVSIPNPVVCELLKWAIDGDVLNGRVPMPRPRTPVTP